MCVHASLFTPKRLRKVKKRRKRSMSSLVNRAYYRHVGINLKNRYTSTTLVHVNMTVVWYSPLLCTLYGKVIIPTCS